MLLARFLSKLFQKEGIILVDSQGQKYICGEILNKEKPLTLKLLNKDLNWKLLIYPELYLGEEFYKGNIEFELRLSDGVRSLTGINTDRGITQALVDQSISGSLGIIPIRITNLFNNTVSVLRVAVNSDETNNNANAAPDNMRDWAGYLHTQTFATPTYYARTGTGTSDYCVYQTAVAGQTNEAHANSAAIFYCILNGNDLEFSIEPLLTLALGSGSIRKKRFLVKQQLKKHLLLEKSTF